MTLLHETHPPTIHLRSKKYWISIVSMLHLILKWSFNALLYMFYKWGRNFVKHVSVFKSATLQHWRSKTNFDADAMLMWAPFNSYYCIAYLPHISMTYEEDKQLSINNGPALPFWISDTAVYAMGSSARSVCQRWVGDIEGYCTSCYFLFFFKSYPSSNILKALQRYSLSFHILP